MLPFTLSPLKSSVPPSLIPLPSSSDPSILELSQSEVPQWQALACSWQNGGDELHIFFFHSLHYAIPFMVFLRYLWSLQQKSGENKSWLMSTDNKQRKLCYLHFDTFVRLSLLVRVVKDKHALTPKPACSLWYSREGYVDLGNSYPNTWPFHN